MFIAADLTVTDHTNNIILKVGKIPPNKLPPD